MLAGLLAAGLALRVILAYLLPGSGFGVDLNAFQFWAANLAQDGPWGFYDRPFFHDYTPGYLYVLWLVGQVGQALGGVGDLVKAPAIVADLVLGYLAWSMVRELGGSERRALLAAALVLFLPITWFDSVVWGQVDSVGVVFLLLSLRAVWRDQPERAALWGTIAAVIKPQLGIVIPIVAAVVIRRALLGRPPDEEGLDPAPTLEAARGGRSTAAQGADVEAAPRRRSLTGRARHWAATEHGPIRILTTTVVGVLTAAALSAPFRLSLPGLIQQVVETAGGYPYLTVNAYNPWALVTQAGRGLAATGAWLCDAGLSDRCPDPVAFGPAWAVFVGSALILAVIGVVVVVVARHPDRRTILVGLAVLAIAFFVVPTRVHERYLYPFVITGAILAALSLRWRVAYLVLVAANFLNLYVVLTTLYPDNPGISDWLGIGGAIRSPLGVVVIALAHLAAFAWAIVQLRPGARATLAREVAAAALAPPARSAGAEPAGRPAPAIGARPGMAATSMSAVSGSPSTASPGGGLGARRAIDAERRAARESERRAAGRTPRSTPPGTSDGGAGGRAAGSLAALGLEGPIAWLRRHIDTRPIRPDRSRALDGEGLGRFARIDLWILVVLVVASLSFRLFRLDQPPTMHFDEVYHARTATEFLQSWRYGEDHKIYEYTHPHLAKYAMAVGLVLFGEDEVSAQSDLGVPVRDAAVERRWDDPSRPGLRAGERLYVATGAEVRVYDLVSRQPVASIDAPGASAVSVDPTEHRLYIGTEGGDVRVVDTTTLDVLGTGTPDLRVPSDPFGSVRSPVRHLLATADSAAVVAATGDDDVVSLDTATGEELGRVRLTGVAQLAEGGTGDALVVRPADVPDPRAAAATLVELLGGAPEEYLPYLTSEAPVVVIPGRLESTNVGDVRSAIAEGRLAGVSVESRSRVAVAGDAGVSFVETTDGKVVATVDLGAPARGVAQVTGLDEPRLYATDGREVAVIRIGGTASADPTVQQRLTMPADVSWVAYDSAVQMVHVLGRRPDGTGATVYVIEPHAVAVFADTRLPFEPSAWAIDDAPDYPAGDRQQLLVFSGDGAAASVEVGRHAFAWRLPGVVAGVLASALLFLLARMLFTRRSVAVALAAFVALDPMYFVQSRIAMNDVYAGLFIVAAVTLFAALWTGWWRWRGAFWVAMPIVGALLGLALASKWVGAYAIGAIALLVLARSALGRLVLIAGLLLITTVLGYIAVSVPSGATSGGNLAFLLIMIAVTIAVVAAAVLRPVAWSDDEVRFAVGAPAVAGIALFLVAAARGVDASVAVGPLSLPLVSLAFVLVALAGVVYLAFLAAGRMGLGPMSPPTGATDPARLLPAASAPPPFWLRPGSILGLPVVWLAISLFAIPLVVYIATYIPWAMIEGHQIVPGWPPGHTGQTLWDLTLSMYDYHDTLRATHAAASPWWAWPFDLKPVWFYQGSFAASTSAAVYDHGSLVTWWFAIPAMAFVAWQSFARRSRSLMLIVVLFACLWLPWARIDRATFQYHWYTTLPFVLLALAYVVAELWNGPSRRTWLLARVAAAVALVGPALLWIFKGPLCTLAGVEKVYPDSPACVGDPGDLVLTTRVLGIAVVVLVGSALVVWQLVRLDRPDADGRIDVPRRLAALALTAVATGVGLVLATGLLGSAVVIALSGLNSTAVALLVAIPLGVVAWVVLTARDARRFVAGFGIAAVAWTVILYPNIAALPLPSAVVNAYQGILPTYLYPFQFAVNTDPASSSPALIALEPAILLGALTLTCVIVAYSAWVWRLALAERAALGPGGSDDGLAAREV